SMVIYPGLFLAIIVSIANLAMSFHVVPIYVSRAEKAVSADAKQILFRNIQRSGYYSLPGGQFKISADSVDISSGRLNGVVIVENPQGGNRGRKITTASSAKIRFGTDKNANIVTIVANNAFQLSQTGGVSFASISILGRFNSMMKESVRFKKSDEVNKIRENPMYYYPIALQAYNAYERLTMELLFKDIVSVLAESQDAVYELSNDEVVIKITGRNCILNTGSAIELCSPVGLYVFDKASGDLRRTFRGSRAILQLWDDPNEEPDSKLTMTFPNARWMDAGQEVTDSRYILRNLRMPDNISAKLGEDIIKTVREHYYLPNPSSRFTAMVAEMNRKIRVTMAEIAAEIHSRLVFGLGCIILILIGIGLGIRLKGGHLLTAFGASAIPAAALLVFIMMGRNITTSRHSAVGGVDAGIIFMWSGLGVLLVFTIWLYRNLSRN
ncbi:MAG: LptF/LptG family permease, partial [Planctomycetes bacterium]|nr:LptF/LptG family permease [Planctomycetota bacterium]